ncbi:hypothetical protein NC651_008046 [Populus alba x Populus x berolinensis]|nr:hypothetical protein NC651_008046 [Populus alba x Populus x berolinensis]
MRETEFNGMRETVLINGMLSQNGASNEDLIKKMLGKPYEIVLGSLLGACLRCRNVDVGERVIQLFLEMELSNSGKYVILSKIYANMRRWDDSAKTRVLMGQCGVSKTLCSNWIDNLNHHSVEKLKTWLPLSAIEQCIRRVSCVLNSLSKPGLEDAIIESKSHSNTLFSSKLSNFSKNR